MKTLYGRIPLFLSPEGEGGAGEGSGSGTPPASSKIKIGDQEFEPGEAKELLEKAQRTQEVIDANKVLFDGTKAPQERERAARAVLGHSGYSREDIDQWVQSNIYGEDPVPEQPEKPQPQNRSDAGVEALALMKKTRSVQLDGFLGGLVTSSLDGHPQVANLLQAAERIRGKDKVGDVRKQISEAIREEAVSNFRRRVQQTGQALDESWMGAEVEKAASKVAERFSTVIGDPSTLGRSAETSASADPFKSRKKAAEPKFDEKKTLGDLEREATDWFRDELIELANGVHSTNASKA